MLLYAMLCYAMPCSAMLVYAMLRDDRAVGANGGEEERRPRGTPRRTIGADKEAPKSCSPLSPPADRGVAFIAYYITQARWRQVVATAVVMHFRQLKINQNNCGNSTTQAPTMTKPSCPTLPYSSANRAMTVMKR